ncbi:hypothetical protein [Hymenobacter cellulosilyticus]|uniref:Uncharacterized protein n=1 Tax=Hymenobacter cellulosilyticus TaxID=2932248 RepID=A0A8T9Q7Z9_9BACT|nr:hypothetical protein [Hymenobacter cellulosilyticus]UOQ71143.1 hypothetical protein MUN79_21135 [Hymenobacter cellulosilyticus]
MEKLKVLLLILGGLAVFVWRMVQKMRETARREQQERPPARPAGGNTSFEEMMRQMQQQNQRGNPGVPAPTTPGGRRLPRNKPEGPHPGTARAQGPVAGASRDEYLPGKNRGSCSPQHRHGPPACR